MVAHNFNTGDTVCYNSVYKSSYNNKFLHHKHKCISITFSHLLHISLKEQTDVLPVMMSAQRARNLSPLRATAAVAASRRIGKCQVSWHIHIDLPLQTH